jgi:hypothetical protein
MTHSLHRDGDASTLRDDYVMLVLTGLDRANDPDVKRQMREVWTYWPGGHKTSRISAPYEGENVTTKALVSSRSRGAS